MRKTIDDEGRPDEAGNLVRFVYGWQNWQLGRRLVGFIGEEAIYEESLGMDHGWGLCTGTFRVRRRTGG